MSMVRLGVLVFGVVASLGSFLRPDDDPLPEVDDCAQASFAEVDGLELVHADVDTIMQDHEIHEVIYGAQGGAMVRVRIRAIGASAPACMEVTMQLDRCTTTECGAGETQSSSSSVVALRTYETEGGRITMDYFAVMPYEYLEGDLVRLTVSQGPIETRAQTSALLWLAFEGMLEPVGDAGL